MTQRLDPGAGWYGEFLRRDPEGLRACLEGAAIPPWDVVESLLRDLAGLRGAEPAARETVYAARLRSAAVAAWDRLPGGEAELRALLSATAAQRAASEAALRTLTTRLTAPTDDPATTALTHELSWTQDDITRATSRHEDLTARLTSLTTPPPAIPGESPQPDRQAGVPDPPGWHAAGPAAAAQRDGSHNEAAWAAGPGESAAGRAGSPGDPSGGPTGAPDPAAQRGGSRGPAGWPTPAPAPGARQNHVHVEAPAWPGESPQPDRQAGVPDGWPGGVTQRHQTPDPGGWAGGDTEPAAAPEVRQDHAHDEAVPVADTPRQADGLAPVGRAEGRWLRGARRGGGARYAGAVAPQAPGFALPPGLEEATTPPAPAPRGARFGPPQPTTAPAEPTPQTADFGVPTPGTLDSRRVVDASAQWAGASGGYGPRIPGPGGPDEAAPRPARVGWTDPGPGVPGTPDPRRAVDASAQWAGVPGEYGPRIPGPSAPAAGMPAGAGPHDALAAWAEPGDPGAPDPRRGAPGDAQAGWYGDGGGAGPRGVGTAGHAPAAGVPAEADPGRADFGAAGPHGVRDGAPGGQGAGPAPSPAARSGNGIAHLLSALRAQGRSGEAHGVICEAAARPAGELPLLAEELGRAGLAADWATLLWEAASLPSRQFAAAAAALAEAGREADCDALLRQGVARPAAEVAVAALALDAVGRAREVDALLAAFVRVRTAEEAAALAGQDPRWFAPRLLRAAQAQPGSHHRHRDLVHALRVAGIGAA